jgi:homoserine acetyltransferase
MNEHDIARGRGEYRDVIRSIRQRALVVSVRSDILYPPHEQQVLARNLPHASYEVLDSGDGHDGFLIESARLGRMIAEFRRSAPLEMSARPLRLARRERLSAVAE